MGVLWDSLGVLSGSTLGDVKQFHQGSRTLLRVGPWGLGFRVFFLNAFFLLAVKVDGIHIVEGCS